MTFKSALDIDCGLRYMYDSLCIMSSCGRKMLLTRPMMTSKSEIVAYHDLLKEIYSKEYMPIAHQLTHLKDINNTLARLHEGVTLDDIELFEIKHLAMLSSDIRTLLTTAGIVSLQLPLLTQVVEILDPDHHNIPSFYIYDSYSEELRTVRQEIRALQGDGKGEENTQAIAQLMQRNADIELSIREQLSHLLQPHASQLTLALNNLSFLDILIAQARQIRDMQLSLPEMHDDGRETSYRAMFNPEVKYLLSQQGREFMPIDINFGNNPVTIIGANMGGKSVVLKTLALNQLLAQYGFGVAAAQSSIGVVEDVALCIGDEQSITKGISSFAGEILAINNVIEKIRNNKSLLALIDEPARTTNPIEGTALVEGLLEVVKDINGGFILTTHYNITYSDVKRYRVKGLVNGVMDYTLVETQSGDVPHEAIAIAESLGIDKQWIEATKKNINN